MKKLPEETKVKLRKLENELQLAVGSGATERAAEIAGQIQVLFGDDRKHHRLLRAKLWAFEAALDANRLAYAESGFVGIRKLAGSTTRLYLEASSLLAVCLLRQKNIGKAKRLIREVISKINNIKSDRTRNQFQKRLITRIEEECILTELIGKDDGKLDEQEIHEKAVQLIQQNSEDEILKLIGNSVPASGVLLLREVREYSILRLPAPDQKLLPAPKDAEKPKNIGKKALAVLRRVGWKTLCNPDSEIYKLWSKRIPKVFNQGYFAAAIVSTMNGLSIGIPLLASGVLATVMKYSAEEFCELAKPKGLMIPRGEKES